MFTLERPTKVTSSRLRCIPAISGVSNPCRHRAQTLPQDMTHTHKATRPLANSFHLGNPTAVDASTSRDQSSPQHSHRFITKPWLTSVVLWVNYVTLPWPWVLTPAEANALGKLLTWIAPEQGSHSCLAFPAFACTGQSSIAPSAATNSFPPRRKERWPRPRLLALWTGS